MINNRECAPHQHEMIDNYLVNARLRFDQENEFKAKQKQEQQEQHDKLKREIYLNGGFVDCVNPGCVAQGTAETSYLCKPCYTEQTRKQAQPQPTEPPPKSFINPPKSPSHISMEVDGGLIVPVFVPRVITPPAPPIKTVGHIVPVAAYSNNTNTTIPTTSQMRVKLPSPNSANSSQPCKNSSCEFYGTPELDYFCSKCSKKR